MSVSWSLFRRDVWMVVTGVAIAEFAHGDIAMGVWFFICAAAMVFGESILRSKQG